MAKRDSLSDAVGAGIMSADRFVKAVKIECRNGNRNKMPSAMLLGLAPGAMASYQAYIYRYVDGGVA